MGLADSVAEALGAPKASRAGRAPVDSYMAENEGEALYAISKGLAKTAFIKGQQPDFNPPADQPGGLAASIEQALGHGPAKPAETKTDRSKWVPDSVEPQPDTPKKAATVTDVAKSIAMAPIHGSEVALTAITNAIAAPVARAASVVKGIASPDYGTPEAAWKAAQWGSDLERSLTYSPRLEGSKAMLDTAGKVIDATKIAGLGPPEAMLMAQPRVEPLPRPGVKPAEVKTGAMGSVGAAGADPAAIARASVANSSPELKAVAEKAISRGKFSQEILDRHIESDSLPIPVRLTEGQATRDPALISNEQNQRGKHTGYANRFNEQNKQLIENTNAIREAAAPDIYVQSKPELGDIVIQAYRDKDAALNQNISKAYKALEDANGGAFPLDAKAFVAKADEKLHKQLLYDHVPPELKRTLERLSENGMTFENFESIRTNLARIQRSTTADGNVKAAAGVIRDTLEEMPMPQGAEHLKPLADQARALAKERFDLIKKDPAYKAVVEGKASADRFIDRHVIGADVKSVETMLNNVPDAVQASRAGIINHLKAQAGIVGETNGTFAQSGYNKALEGLRPKLGVVFDSQQAKQLETLGNVARYTQEQPKGSFVNNSNTLVGALAEGVKNAAEGTANAVFRFPIGTAVREASGRISEGKIVNRSLQTGAGIRLKDVGRK